MPITPYPWSMEVAYDPEETAAYIRAPRSGDELVATVRTKADALLIVDAPELLETVKDLATCLRTFRNTPKREQDWTSLDEAVLDHAFYLIQKLENN